MKKHKKKQNLGKKLMSSLLAMTMALEMTPCLTMAVNAAVDEKLVSALAEAYDGDEARAREELEALYQSGIIDEEGNMVPLAIQENGADVTLEDVTARISAGEEVGALTVNGHDSTEEQLMKIQQTKNTLELVKLLSQDVEVTDEHVANLESLIQGIADGSVDIDAALESGVLSMENQQSTHQPSERFH